jgi:CHASE3 domain sensor protein
MSSQATTPAPAGRLAGRARLFVFGLLFASLIGPLGLLFAGYQVYKSNAALNDYRDAASLYRSQAEAILRLNDMETAFNRFLLDGNSANLALVQRDKERIEQVAQQDDRTKGDKLLQTLMAKEQQWFTHVAQPLIESRKGLPAGQGISEDFLARYRASGSDLGAINFETEMERTYQSAAQELDRVQRELRIWISLAYLAAALCAGVLAFAMASGALRRLADLKRSVNGGSN